MLVIKNLTKKYGDKIAVDNLSVEIKSGEIYGFIGHNGAGKTTTIKCCCGLLDFDEGEIYVDGISVKEDPLECKRRLAYLPDNPDLYDFMSGIKYLNFVADIYEMTVADRQEQIKKLADMFGITKDLAQPISSYSHGMKQKLALISAFMHKPKLVLLDEPFVGLDPIATHRMKEEMRDACKQGAAVFFSTHVLEVAEKLCDKIAIIRDGQLIISGPTNEVKGTASLEDVFLKLEDNDE
ncbi:MAG: ABC transporter ATP-binding protein [Acutalibacteraceae bacterium]|nr:ABC transporter ATP-binding protein [Acutalibacteraceae bacterium]